ncbi:RNA polymerase sigma factor [Streptomyces sp. NPDC059070]|uniref:RNA polymerase sigma factor n=1 Tax=unclassified Streptomyces TaxID=2593676 RepID=UPI0034E19A05
MVGDELSEDAVGLDSEAPEFGGEGAEYGGKSAGFDRESAAFDRDTAAFGADAGEFGTEAGEFGADAGEFGGDLGQRLLRCYPGYIDAEPAALRRRFRHLSLAACQDIAQEAFLRVGRKAEAGELVPETNVMAYLRRTAVHLALDRFRERRRGLQLSALGDVPAGVPEQRTAAYEDLRVLRDLVIPAIGELPESQRRQVVDLQSQGLSDAQIADRLGIAPDRLHNLRNKAVADLRRSLAGHIRDAHRKKQQHGKKER